MNAPRFVLCLLSCLAASILAASAASPELNIILPRGGQSGTEVEVSFNGNRLQDAEEILSYSPGITVSDLKVESPNVVKAKLKIAPDCPPGEHLFRLRAKSGLSYARSFWTGPFPVVGEKEPNTQFTEAQEITSGVTVAGVAGNEDVDYFKLEAKKGERITVEVEGIRLGNTFWDPYVAILNSKKFELAVCDDSSLLVQDAHASVFAPEDGTYYIEVRDSSYAGNDNAHYRLHVGSFPRPTAVYPAGGKAGTEVEVTFLGDPGGPISRKVTVPENAGGKLPLFAEANGQSAPSPNLFLVSPLDNALEAEPNDSHAQAKESQEAVPAPVAFNGVIEKPGDMDWFKFSAKKDQRLEFTVYARALRSPLDPVLELFNKDGGGISGNDDAGANPDSKIGGFTVPEDGEYYIRVRDHLLRGGEDFVYRVEIAPPQPALNGYITRFDRIDSQMRQLIPVPRGNRYATLINVDRLNCGGDVVWETENLPPGVTLECDPLPAGLGQYAIVFAAAPDAEPAGRLATLRPKLADPNNASVPGNFVQNIEFVQGEPNATPYVISSQNKLPVAVTEEAPFTLEIEKPSVPLVQSGTIDLKVKATRPEGFTAPITLRMLWNPPGISSPGTVAIPEGQNEAVYTLTANGNAPAQKWRLTVLGETDAGNGLVMVASPLTEISVEQPWLTMKMEMATIEQGKSGEIICSLEVLRPFEGKAKVNLFGLPAKVTTVEREISAEDTELRFPVATEPDSPTGKHQNLFCQAIVMVNGAGVPHTIGQGGVLRVDPPPPAPAEPPPAAVAEAPKPAGAPAEKPLSRLEQLRLQAAKAAAK